MQTVFEYGFVLEENVKDGDNMKDNLRIVARQ